MANNRHAELVKAFLEELCEPARRSRLVPWSDWVRSSVGAPAAIGLTLSLAACGGSSSTDDQVGSGGDAGSGGAATGGTQGMAGSQLRGTGGTSSGGAAGAMTGGTVVGSPVSHGMAYASQRTGAHLEVSP